MALKRSVSSKHTSIRVAASTPLVYSAREDFNSASSNARSNDQWEPFLVPTGVSMSIHNTNKLLDVAALRESDLDKLKKSDPFMYYSIPRTSSKAARPNLTLVRPEPVNKPTAPNEFHRIASDSVLKVKRRSRISFEKHYDMEEMIEEIKELQADHRRLHQISDLGS
jgi:hypothetical protein